MTPNWHVPEDDATTAVAASRPPGGTTLQLLDAGRFGTAGWPKLVVLRRGVPPKDVLVTVLEFSGRAGNVLTGVAPSPGHADAAIEPGDRAFLGPTKLHITELQDGVTTLDGRLTTLEGEVAATVGDLTYVHTQAVPSASWTVAHHLGKWPSVTVVDSADSVVIGDFTYLDPDHVRLDFVGAFAGKAFLN